MVIIGAEHDAVELCSFAATLGWDVLIVASLSDPKTINDFPGAQKVLHESTESMDVSIIKRETAVVLMSHNYQATEFLLSKKRILVI